jgi:hypothetical protein
MQRGLSLTGQIISLEGLQTSMNGDVDIRIGRPRLIQNDSGLPQGPGWAYAAPSRPRAHLIRLPLKVVDNLGRYHEPR